MAKLKINNTAYKYAINSIIELYPSIPKDDAEEIRDFNSALLKSINTEDIDYEDNVQLFKNLVGAHIRHKLTPYDSLYDGAYIDKREAREIVSTSVSEIMRNWEQKGEIK